MLISALIFKLQFNPIDTNKYPIDRKILSENDNSKIVIREKKKGKSNEIIFDTIEVKDQLIFRKIISNKQSKIFNK